MVSIADSMKQKRAYVNSNTGWWKLITAAKRRMKKVKRAYRMFGTSSRQHSYHRERFQLEKQGKKEENSLEEIMARKFPKLGKEANIQIQEAQSLRYVEFKETHTKTNL